MRETGGYDGGKSKEKGTENGAPVGGDGDEEGSKERGSMRRMRWRRGSQLGYLPVERAQSVSARLKIRRFFLLLCYLARDTF